MESLEFTGERYVPGRGGARMAYEHLHRYLFALRWSRGEDVLDVASGEGYGAALLASSARRVWGLELDGAAAAHARAHYRDGNLLFVRGDACSLPFASAGVGLVVAFEVLEHVKDPESLVREAARVLRPDGLLVVSTPNKAAYSDGRNYRNPFHVREFYREEFVALLERHFRQVRLAGQRVRAGSLIEAGGGGAAEVHLRATPGAGGECPEPLYYLALCSQGEAEMPLPAHSAYLDAADALLAEWAEAEARSLREIEKLNREVRALGAWGSELENTVRERDRTIEALREEMAREVEARDRTIEGQRQELAERERTIEERTAWARSLEREIEERDRRIVQANDEIDRVNAELRRVAEHLARIRHALLYRVLCRLGILPQ